MINIIRVITFVALLAGVRHSCKKEYSCEGCINGNNPPVALTNHPPIANAGNDTTITFPYNTVNMDGSRSTDPDNNITSYQWTKIAGPSSSAITNGNDVYAVGNNSNLNGTASLWKNGVAYSIPGLPQPIRFLYNKPLRNGTANCSLFIRS